MTPSLPTALPPSAPAEPLIGAARALADPVARVPWFVRLQQTQGDVARFTLGPRSFWVFFHPDAVRRILYERQTNYAKGPTYAKLQPLLGQGLFTAEGEFWARQRRLIQPIFHQRRIAGFAEAIAETGEAMLARWRGRGEAYFDLVPEVRRVTLEAVLRCMFGVRLDDTIDQVIADLQVANDAINDRMFAAVDVPLWLPLPAHRQILEAVKRLDAVIHRVIDERRRAEHPSGDMLDMLLAARDDETNEAMSDRQVRDEVMQLFQAGQDATANTLTWAMAALAQLPGQARRLRAELERVVGDRRPAFEDLPRLVEMEALLNEVMRLYPPVWINVRQAIDSDAIGGYTVPAGQEVIIVPYVTHRHPDFWERAEAFDPDRFLAPQPPGPHRFDFFPFGGGGRICIGNHFAMMELKLLLAMLLQAADWELRPGTRLEAEGMTTLKPRGAMPMRFRFRHL